jgi:hypothetical protein
MAFSKEYTAALASGHRQTGDGKVVVGRDDHERVYPCEVNARMLDLGFPCPEGWDVPRPHMFGHIEYEQTDEGLVAHAVPPSVHYHGQASK